MKKLLSLILVSPLLAAAGCGNYSNAIFEEDVLFAEAVPSLPDVDLNGTETLAGDEDLAALLLMGHDTSRGLNVVLSQVNELVDQALALPPSSRDANTRTWGPRELEDGVIGTLEVEHYDGGLWSWTGSVQTAEAPEAEPVFSGWMDPLGQRDGSGLPCGGFEIDLGALSEIPGQIEQAQGLLDAGFRLDGPDGDFSDLEVTIDGVYQPRLFGQSLTGDYIYRRGPSQAASFYYDVSLESDGTPRPENYQVFARWEADAAGRADALTSDVDVDPPGDRPEASIDCWNPDGREVYASSGWSGDERGSPTLCVYQDAVDPDERRGRQIEAPEDVSERGRAQR